MDVISDIDAGNAMLEAFRLDYNKRFACDPQSTHDAHRKLPYADKLDEIFSIQSERKLTKELTFQCKNQFYLLIRKKSVMSIKSHRNHQSVARTGGFFERTRKRNDRYRNSLQLRRKAIIDWPTLSMRLWPETHQGTANQGHWYCVATPDDNAF